MGSQHEKGSDWLVRTYINSLGMKTNVKLLSRKSSTLGTKWRGDWLFSLKNGDYHLGIFFLCLGVFLLGLLDSNCIALSFNKCHQSWFHLTMARRKEQWTEHIVVGFFSLGTRGRFHFMTEYQVILAAKINHLMKILALLFVPVHIFRSQGVAEKKKTTKM